uniref:Secreted protein n=1 Tax=Salix viminalis TaxID=40686 RepID=A0A6N2LLP1_SALVM
MQLTFVPLSATTALLSPISLAALLTKQNKNYQSQAWIESSLVQSSPQPPSLPVLFQLPGRRHPALVNPWWL